MRFLFCMLWVVAACNEKTVRPESVPISTGQAINVGGQVDMALDLEGPKPVNRMRLKELWPQLKGLTEDQLMGVSNAVNSVPAPCEPCGTLPIAHCADREQSSSCEIIPKLIDRAIRLAKTGRSKKEIKASVNYPDLWFPLNENVETVLVVLYRDQESPFADQANETLQKLQMEFSETVEFVIHEKDVAPKTELGVRSRPTWFINGHRFRGTQSVKTLARFIRFEVMDQEQ